MALGEGYATSRDFTLKRNVERAADALVAAGSETGWGWDPRDPSPNALATTFAVLALKAARVSGIEVRDAAFDEALAAYDRATGADGLVGHREPGDGVSLSVDATGAPGVPLFTAAAALGRILAGEPQASVAVSRGCAVVARHRPDAARPDPLYAWLGTYALFHGAGHAPDDWRSWHEALRRSAVATQRKDGPDEGSWDPAAAIGAIGGRAASTAATLLALEVYFRYERVEEMEKRR